MIKVGDIRDAFFKASGTLSNINRQIAFAGIGIVWIFVEVKTNIIIDKFLAKAIVGFIVSFILDISQYAYKSILFQIFLRYYEITAKKKDQKNILEKTVEYHNGWNVPTWIFFAFKVIATIIGYKYILLFLINRINII